MIDGWLIVAASVVYVGLLFAVAWAGDRYWRDKVTGDGRPVIYALTLAVYCTSWTFFGSVGLAAQSGYDFVPVYLGPILLFVFGWRLVLRIVRVAKSQNITSVADFLAARYGKSPAVAAIVTIVAVIGTLPYIALQLKAIATSIDILLGGDPLESARSGANGSIDTALVIAAALAAFAMLFGTRHADATEHQDGLMMAVAAESLVKLAAFLAVGIFVTFVLFDGFGDLLKRATATASVQAVFAQGVNGGTWLTVTLLSLVCIVLLPRQFHVTVVENHSANEVRRAAWLFPLYLVLINIFVVPIALAGLLLLPRGLVPPDLFVLALPMSQGQNFITMAAFIGGLSAATAMVIVDSIALAIMVCNGLVVPALLSRRAGRQTAAPDTAQEEWSPPLLAIRRAAITAILLLGYLVYLTLASAHGLAAIGLVAFAAIAQLAPAFFGGLFWRKGTARGAIAGILAGFAVWAYTLLVPWIAKAGWLPASLISDGPFGIAMLRPQALFFLQFEPLTHGVVWSLAVNVVAYITVSLLRAPQPIERLQAHIFVQDELPRSPPTPVFRIWRTAVTVEDLQRTVARYLGTERAERSFNEYAKARSVRLSPTAEADIALLRHTEHLLTSAIGAASARLVLTLLLRRRDVASPSALKLLDDASEALQYNRDLMQSALDQVGQGISVFDEKMQLICWNRQFRELLALPQDLGRVGAPLDQIMRSIMTAEGTPAADVDAKVRDRLYKLAISFETFQHRVAGSDRVVEVRSNAMAQGGIVATYTDITDRVAAAEALERANETLERRVIERTAELTRVNDALAVAKAKADEANLDKTRFIAAASHDILQPLNAARLYATSLSERPLATSDARLARNVDVSLSAVEEILGTLIDISRIDTGRLEPEIAVFPLQPLLDQLKVEFEPMAVEKGLELRIVPCSAWVRSDRTLLRRVLQNLVSNAVKYTPRGRVVLGCRRGPDTLRISVLDTGPGIPADKHELIYKEFQRLKETASGEPGLGLGLSIVQRITRILGHEIRLRSRVGHGSAFEVSVPHTAAVLATTAAMPPPAAPLGQVAGTTVLCIDNEQAVLEGMETLLNGWGCEVITATGLQQAVHLAAAAQKPPALIVADYHLDDGTGLEAIDAVRGALDTAIAAVILTADPSPEVLRTVRGKDLVLLRKPLKAAQLRAILGQAIVRRSASAAAE